MGRGTHPWVRGLFDLRAGGPVPVKLVTATWGTPNIQAGSCALAVECVRRAELGHPLASPEAAREAAAQLVANLEWERERGLWGGEGHAAYGLHHELARWSAHDSVVALRERYPEVEELARAEALLEGRIAFVVSLALELRATNGFLPDWDDRSKVRAAHDPDGYGGPRGLETIAQLCDPLPLHTLHPKLRERFRAPGSVWWSQHRETDWLLYQVVTEAAELRSRLPPHAPRVTGRTRDPVYWRRSPDGSVHVLMPTITANPDTDSDPAKVVDGWWQFRAPDRYEWVTGPARKQEGTAPCWEERYDRNGRLVLSVRRPGLQGAPGGTRLPHPDGTRPTGPGWQMIGPGSEPYPVAELPPADAPPEPPAEDPGRESIHPGSLTARDWDGLSGPDKRSALAAIFAVAEHDGPDRIVRVRDRLAASIRAQRDKRGHGHA